MSLLGMAAYVEDAGGADLAEKLRDVAISIGRNGFRVRTSDELP
jgi:hypothetical protein